MVSGAPPDPNNEEGRLNKAIYPRPLWFRLLRFPFVQFKVLLIFPVAGRVSIALLKLSTNQGGEALLQPEKDFMAIQTDVGVPLWSTMQTHPRLSAVGAVALTLFIAAGIWASKDKEAERILKIVTKYSPTSALQTDVHKLQTQQVQTDQTMIEVRDVLTRMSQELERIKNNDGKGGAPPLIDT